MRSLPVLFLFLILPAGACFAQNQAVIDSLERLALRAPNDSAKAEFYDQICDYLSPYNNELRGVYAQKLLALAERKRPDGTYETLLPRARPRGLYHLGLFHYQRDEYPEALRCFYTAQPLYQEYNMTRGVAAIQSCIAKVYVAMEQWSDAESYYLQSKATYESVPFNKGVRSVLINLGHMHGVQGHRDKALEYYLQAEKTFTDPNERYAMATVYSNIGYCYRLDKQTALARSYFEKAAREYERTGERENLELLQFNLGDLWFEEEQWHNALAYYRQGLGSALDSRRNGHIQRGYNQLALIYLHLGEEARTLPEKDSLYLLAFNSNEKARLYGDSAMNLSRHQQLAEMQTQYETEKKEREINQLSSEAKAREIVLLKQEVELRQQRLEAANAREQAALLEKSNTQIQLDLELNASRLREQNAVNLQKQQELELLNKEYLLREKEARRERQVSWGLKIGLAVFALLLFILLRLFWQKNRANREILQQNREITRQQQEIERQNQRLEEASRFKSQFLSNMSHEIRTPLNTVINVARLLADTPLQPRQRNYANAVQQASQNLLFLVNDILDLSKIEAGKIDLLFAPCNIRNLLEQQLELLRFNNAKPELRLELHCAPELPATVVTDAGRLGQILLNLLGNALKFTEKGAITLFCAVQKHLPPDQLVLDIGVRDTGIGIPPDKLEHIFDSFTQAEEDTHLKFGGTGLGLAISKQLVELLGGALRVESTPGQGAEFRFTLPVKVIEHESPAGQPLAPSDKLPGKKILLVEDNAFNQMLAAELLEKIMDHPRITLALNGAEALEKAEEEVFDLILMDIRMPVMDGFSATAALRRRGLNTPVVALTANASGEEQQKCLDAGMNDYLSKPIDLALLREKVEQWAGG